MYSIQCTLYNGIIEYYTVYSVECTLYSVQRVDIEHTCLVFLAEVVINAFPVGDSHCKWALSNSVSTDPPALCMGG